MHAVSREIPTALPPAIQYPTLLYPSIHPSPPSQYPELLADPDRDRDPQGRYKSLQSTSLLTPAFHLPPPTLP